MHCRLVLAFFISGFSFCNTNYSAGMLSLAYDCANCPIRFLWIALSILDSIAGIPVWRFLHADQHCCITGHNGWLSGVSLLLSWCPSLLHNCCSNPNGTHLNLICQKHFSTNRSLNSACKNIQTQLADSQLKQQTFKFNLQTHKLTKGTLKTSLTTLSHTLPIAYWQLPID